MIQARIHMEVIRKNLREFGVAFAGVLAKVDLNLPKLVVKMGPEHQLPLAELMEKLKSNAVLIKTIQKW